MAATAGHGRLAILIMVLALPLVGLFFFRLYENQLIRQTEAELIAQGAVLAADLCAGCQRRRHFRRTSSARRCQAESGDASRGDDLDGRTSRSSRASISPPTICCRPGPPASPPPPIRPSRRSARSLSRHSRRRRRKPRWPASGCSIRTASSLPGARRSACRWRMSQEVREALAGHYASVLRQRIPDQPPPPLYSVSRGTKVRVFVAMPVAVDGQVAGVVYLSRTPNNIVKHLYGERGKVALAAHRHARRHAADRLRLPAHRQPADLRADGPHPAHRRRRPRRDPAARPSRHARNGRAVRRLPRHGRKAAGALRHDPDLRHPCLARAQIAADGDPGRGRAAARFRRGDGRGRAAGGFPATSSPMPDGSICWCAACSTWRAPKTWRRAAKARRSMRRWRCCRWTDRLAVSVEAGGDIGLAHSAENAAIVLANLIDNSARHGATQVSLVGGRRRGQGDDCGQRRRRRHFARATGHSIFEPFFTTRRDVGGTGMGLGIVLALLKAHDGTIKLVDSERGTRFEIIDCQLCA